MSIADWELVLYSFEDMFQPQNISAEIRGNENDSEGCFGFGIWIPARDTT